MNHLYASDNVPSKPGFYDLPEPFPRLTNDEKKKLVAENPFTNCTNISTKYDMMCKLGQGTFGEVYKAREKGTNNYVALKKIPPNAEYGGVPFTAIREIRILQQLKHDNIIKFVEVCKANIASGENSPAIFYLALEYCDYSLDELLKEKNINFTLSMRKCIMKQILGGLYFMHFSNILHRDIKPANILITKAGTIRIADFGLARSLSKLKHEVLRRPYTNCVVTLWYRAPELLLGDCAYSSAIDVWSAGCLMAELSTRSPILAGNSEKEQLLLILNLCGSITKEIWPEVERLPLYINIELPTNLKRRVVERLRRFLNDNQAIDLLDKMLILSPYNRINVDEALNHAFFWEDPLPEPLLPILTAFRRMKLKPNVSSLPEANNGYVEQIF